MILYGSYNLYIDDYVYYHENLEDACKHLCEVLKAMNLAWFYDKGEFKKTRNLKNVWKTKIYLLEIKHPNIKFKIHYRGKVELLPELVMYYLRKYIKADT